MTLKLLKQDIFDNYVINEDINNKCIFISFLDTLVYFLKCYFIIVKNKTFAII